MLSILTEQRNRRRLDLHAFVLMPDHIHLLLTPAPDISIEKAIQFIKGGFSHAYARGPVWQKSFTLHRVESASDYSTHREYIHQNPVRARMVTEPQKYSYSSAFKAELVDPPPLWTAAKAAGV
jgi:putative transposase